ncbi:MAG: zinc-binding dehydrogenase [Muribaculaceae bacterium]|nr:zinc-binding dehydrogenase [Muribaculaceae bacterium]
MRAIVINGCCSADQLQVSDIPVPQVKPGWVLVKIHAAGMNHSEAILRTMEADNDYINTPIVPGIECVGEIADASDSRYTVGDRVIALMGGMGRSFNGSYAEYALLPTKNVFKVDTRLDWLQLAAVPETYFTAYGSLSECLLLQDGDVLLVRGATSTVGQAAIQLGKAMGATVIAAARRESSFEGLMAIGADHCVLDDGCISDQTLPVRPNKLLELIGPRTLRDSLLTVSRPGYVCDTGVLGNVFTIPQFDPIKYIPNGVFLTGFFSNFPTQTVIDRLFELIERNAITPLYKHVFSLNEIVEAHTLLEKGGAGGKIILKIL